MMSNEKTNFKITKKLLDNIMTVKLNNLP